jgi:glycosyltransferase involved in cell wall biosynthesis
MVHELSQNLLKNGHRVGIISGGKLAEDIRQKNRYRLKRFRSSQKKTFFAWLFFMVKTFFALARFPHYDVVVSTAFPPFLLWLAQRWARKKNAQHIFWCEAVYPDVFHQEDIKLKPWLLKRLRSWSRRLMRQVDLIIVPGACMKRHLTHTGCEPSKIQVIEGWADMVISGDIKDYPPKATQTLLDSLKSGRVKVKEGESQDEEAQMDGAQKFKVLYAGHLEKQAELETVIQAMWTVKKAYDDVEFIFLAHGHGVERLKAERDVKGLDNMRFLPPQPRHNIRQVMQDADVHLVCMRGGIVGMRVPAKIYSAFAVERPCILVGPMKSSAAQIIKECKAGHTVSSKDYKTLAHVVKAYRSDAHLWFSAQEGANRAHQRCAPSAAFEAWANLVK